MSQAPKDTNDRPRHKHREKNALMRKRFTRLLVLIVLLMLGLQAGLPLGAIGAATNTPVPTFLPPSATPGGAMVGAASTTPGEGPYTGTAAVIPGKIEAENYDTGGEGSGYHDTDALNNTTNPAFRTTENVDLENTSDTGGGYNVGWIAASEWLNYTVNVQTTGVYNITIRLASTAAGATFHLELDNTRLTGSLSVPNTGGWQAWQTVSASNINLKSGPHLLRFVADSYAAGTTTFGNLNWLNFALVTAEMPYQVPGAAPGSPLPIPGQIEAEYFDQGSEGVAFHNLDNPNHNTTNPAFRTSETEDMENTSDTGGGYNLGWMQPGEWLKYTVNVQSTGAYSIGFRLSSPATGAIMHLEMDGMNVTGNITVPNTGGWQTWSTVTATKVNLISGTHVLRLVIDSFAPGTTQVANLNWINFAQTTVEAPYGGTAATVGGKVEAENFDTGGEGVAFHNLDNPNHNTTNPAFRTSETEDIENTSDTGGGYDLGYIAASEWMKYTVNVTATAAYNIDVRVASPAAGATFHLEIDGANVTGAYSIPNTGGWQNWQTITKNSVNLTAGSHVLRLVIDGFASGTTQAGNFNWINFTATSGASGPGGTPTPPPPGCSTAADCVSKMTLAEKIGQMTQANKNAFTQSGNSMNDITTYAIGSVLSGGGEGPTGAGGTASQWADMVDNYQSYAVQNRLHIPLIYGIDAVHGNSNIYGAVIFPHNIGLGAMHDTGLITQIGQVTRDEVRGTGIQWAFSPCLCVPQDDRWGRTYEGFSEVTSDVQVDGAAIIVGLQGANGALGPTNILATAKHFVGDGHTTWGTGSSGYQIDQGDAQVSESVLDAVDLPPYQTAVQNGIGSVMASYSSWNGVKMHANQYLLTTVLKGQLGFKGFIVSDWAAINQISSDYAYGVRTAINAGVDMVMVPTDYKTFIGTLTNEVTAGRVPMSRIDDAVTRILTIKFALGLFSQPYSNRTLTAQVGSTSHRSVARQAVRESLVLLKNSNATLPLSKTASYRLVVGGSHSNDLGYQMGGWSITWQGGSGSTTIGTTLWQAIQQAGLSSSVQLNFVGNNTAGSYTGDVGIVAIGETPYAEGHGDSSTLGISSSDAQQVTDVCSRVTKCVVVLFSGRPVIINTQLNQSSAFVAAFLPGTEGQGITDVLFGDYPFKGKLTFTWPNSVSQEPINNGDGKIGLFPYGFGITPY